MPKEIGTNIRVIDKEDRIVFVVSKNHKMTRTQSGNSLVLAKTAIFESVGDISGDNFEGKAVGLNLMLVVKDKAKKAKATEKPKLKKKPRLDDDED